MPTAYDSKLSDSDALGNVEYSFIAITPRSTLSWSIGQGPIN